MQLLPAPVRPRPCRACAAVGLVVYELLVALTCRFALGGVNFRSSDDELIERVECVGAAFVGFIFLDALHSAFLCSKTQ